MIFRKSEDMSLGSDAVPTSPPAAGAGTTGAPSAPVGNSTDPTGVTGMVNQLKNLGANIDLLSVLRARARLEAATTHIQAAGNIVAKLQGAAFIDESFQANPNPCDVGSPSIKVASLNEVIKAFNTWESYFTNYNISYGDYIKSLLPIDESIEFYGANNTAILQSNDYASYIKHKAQVESDYQQQMTNYTIEARSKKVQFAFAAEQLKFKKLMAQLCVVQTKYDNDEAIVGVGSRQDWMKIISLYDAAIKMAGAIGNKIVAMVPDENGQILQEQYSQQAQLMTQNRRKYLVKPYQRLFPGAGK